MPYNRSYFKLAIMGTIIGVCVLYAGFKMMAIIRGPSLDVLSPSSGAVYDKELAVIKGRAERISKIYMNDRQIFTDDQGRFSEPLLLFEGYNILTLRATDTFGRTVSKQIRLIYQG